MHFETAVKERYTEAAQSRVEALCCPVQYRPEFLKVIPPEILERDYGCGDPSQYLRPGETVLDLGSGAGKICFIAAQVVGPTGRVIGIDVNDEMLGLARKHQSQIGDALGYHNVEFRKGRIQDLALDLAKLDNELALRPLTGADAFLAAEARAQELRLTAPLVASDSIDVVVSNCVLNLVQPNAKLDLFTEIFRVLKPGGRAVISDIVSSEPVPAALQNDPELWSGCISGALTEPGLVNAFVNAGFYGVRIVKWETQPWRTVQGIEFRSMTVEAFKSKLDASEEGHHTVIYKGPFREILDDHNHRLERGRRHVVSDDTYELYKKAPYREHFEFADAQQPGSVKAGKENLGSDTSQCCNADGVC